MSALTRLSVSRFLPTPAQESFQIVEDVERFPEFMTNIKSVNVVVAEGNRKVVEWEMIIDDVPLEWTEEILYDHTALRVAFHSIEGIFKRFDGTWQVSPWEGGSQVELEIDYEFGLPEIEDIIGPILQSRLTTNLEAIMGFLESRASTQ